MKKTQMGRTVWAAAVIVCCIALFTTCKNSVGLGETIDINPPKITVNSPPTAAVVRNSFTLQGSIEDDTGVKTVTVAFIDREGKPRAASADVDNKAKTWKVCINRKDESGHFPLKDGQQTFTVTAEDTSGKKDNTEIVLIIDNTPPFLVLDRPSTVMPPPPQAQRHRSRLIHSETDFYL